jgi:thymidine kinase
MVAQQRLRTERLSTSGAVTLGGIADKITMLEVACSRCGRHGRLSVARVIEQHGENAKLPALREILAGRNGQVFVTLDRNLKCA